MVRFLSQRVVVKMHSFLIGMYGGTSGLRDVSLLDSALNQPKLEYHLLEASLCKMAAAYGYHLCKNHPFLDGNKRTARMCMIIFLRYNGLEIVALEEETLDVILAIAKGTMNKEQLESWLEICTKSVETN